MSKANPTPREEAERIVLRAMQKAETHYTDAISKEEGNLSRLDLIDSYAAALDVMSTALRKVSTESPC